MWRLAYDVPSNTGKRRQVFRGFSGSKKDAEAYLRKLIHEADRGGVQPHSITVGQFLEQWLSEIEPSIRPNSYYEEVSRKTHERYTQMVMNNIKPVLGDIRLQKLETSHIQVAWKQLLENGNTQIDGGLKPKTVRNIHGVLTKALGYAKLNKYVSGLATEGVKLPKVERRKISILDRQQSLELIRALDGHWIQPVVIIALTTGMRQGEIVALKWSDVDFEKKTLRIERSMSLTKAEGLKLKSPKTEAGKRTISLSQLSVDALRRVSAKQSEKRLRLRLVKSNDSMVFDRLLHGTDDGFLSPQFIGNTYRRLMSRMDLPNVGFHGLRHTHISQLLLAGHPIKVVSARAGHASVSMTLDIYGHLLPTSDADMMAAFDKELERLENRTA